MQSFATKAAFRFGYGFAAGEADVSDVEMLLAQVHGKLWTEEQLVPNTGAMQHLVIIILQMHTTVW